MTNCRAPTSPQILPWLAFAPCAEAPRQLAGYDPQAPDIKCGSPSHFGIAAFQKIETTSHPRPELVDALDGGDGKDLLEIFVAIP